VGSRHVAEVLSVLRQGLTLDLQFGSRSIEALLWVAETVEEGVYEAGSLRRTPEGFSFALDNPLLRVGAFTRLRVLVNGSAMPGDCVRFRRGAGFPWRTADSLAANSVWDLAPGDRTEFELVGRLGDAVSPITVRLELYTPALPPLVWFEFRENPTEVRRDP
jgi:hypothetical protein